MGTVLEDLYGISDLFGRSGLGFEDVPALTMPATALGTAAEVATAPSGGGWWDTIMSGLGAAWKPIGKTLEVVGSPTTLNLAKLGLTGMGAYAGSQAMAQAGEQMKLLRASEQRAAEAQRAAGDISAEARRAGSELSGQARTVAAPSIAAEQRLIPVGTAALLGEAPLPAGLEASVEKWTREAKAAAASYYARAGISDSTMMTQLDSWIDSQAQEMRTKLAQSLLASGETAATAAGQALGTATSAAGMGLGTATSAAGAAGAPQAGLLPQQQSTALATALQEANRALYDLLGRTAA